jgi:hypothetical protein
MQNKSFIYRFVVKKFKLYTYEATFYNHKKNALSYNFTALIINIMFLILILIMFLNKKNKTIFTTFFVQNLAMII